jgi:hypothetical protein
MMRQMAMVVALAGLMGATGAASAAPAQVTRKAHHKVHEPKRFVKRRTCRALGIFYNGMYRVDDDAPFAGPSHGRMCIREDSPSSFTIEDNLPRSPGGGVGGYPNVYVGRNYHSSDPQSRLPARVSAASRLTLHVSATGHAPGGWLTDADIWVFPSQHDSGHGRYEVVSAVRWQGATFLNVRPGHGWHHVRVGRQRLWVTSWVTCPECTHPWPIILFRPGSMERHATVTPAALVRAAQRLGYVPGGQWIGSVHFGTELFWGGRGLTDGVTVTGLPAAVPVIRELGSGQVFP